MALTLSQVRDRIRAAQHNLLYYAACKALQEIKYPRAAVSADFTDGLSDEARRLFQRVGCFGNYTLEQKTNLAEKHEVLITEARKQGITRSLAFDIMDIKVHGNTIEPSQRQSLVERASENIDILIAAEASQETKDRLANIRRDIERRLRFLSLPAWLKEPQAFKF